MMTCHVCSRGESEADARQIFQIFVQDWGIMDWKLVICSSCVPTFFKRVEELKRVVENAAPR